MELKPEQLPADLRRHGLRPAYLLAGEEPLLVHEAADAVRAAARAAGHDERDVLHAEPGFDWSQLAAAGDNLSLFASRRLIELHLPDKGPGKPGADALGRYLDDPPADTVLIVLAPGLASNQRRNAWYKQLAGAGAAVYAWPLPATALPDWIERRAAGRGVTLTSDAVAVLAALTEGNLLAAAQEIDRLALLFPDTTVDADAMREAGADAARFAVFDLPAKALAGDAEGAVRSLLRLREEGVDAVPVLAALTRELRLLHRLAGAGDRERALASVRMPPARKRQLAAAASRIRPTAALALLRRAARLDRINKGAAPGRPWEELVRLALDTAAAAGPRSPGRQRRPTAGNQTTARSP